MRIKNLPFRVIGVLAPKGQGQWGQDQDDIVLAPYTTVQKKLLGITYINQIVGLGDRDPDEVEETAVADHAPDARAPPHQQPRGGRLQRAHARGDGGHARVQMARDHDAAC